MSKITIRNLCLEMHRVSLSEYNLYGNIEIVPRKIVEMIIEKCKEIQHNNDDDDDRHECGKWCASDEIKDYAESLLKQFEGEV